MNPVRIILTALLFTCFAAAAQEQRTFQAPDYKNIKKVTTTAGNKYYYPALLERYRAVDTTLTVEEIHMLYYGSFFNNYKQDSKFSELDYRDSISAIYNKNIISENDRKNLVRYYEEELKTSPFDLGVLNGIIYAYDLLQDPKKQMYLNNARKIFHVIYASGDGMTLKSGFHVNAVPDEYSVLQILGYEFGGEQSLRGTCDYLKVKDNTDHIKGLYFDVTQIFEGYKKMFGEDKSKKK